MLLGRPLDSLSTVPNPVTELRKHRHIRVASNPIDRLVCVMTSGVVLQFGSGIVQVVDRVIVPTF